MRFTPQLLPSRSGNLGVLLLNNPKALNALSLEMMHCMRDVFDEWFGQSQQDGSSNSNRPKAILLKASHENAKVPAFCAGGDVKRVMQSALEDPKKNLGTVRVGQGHAGLDSSEFFRQEYINNHTLATASTSSLAESPLFDKDPTVIAFMDGLVMGGGVGISIYGRYRIATERTVWAMPETGIGLFPDVGSLYWMPRLLAAHKGMAVYLALTGRRLKAADLLYTGLVTHYVPSDQLDDLEAAMVEALEPKNNKDNNSSTDPLAPVLMSFHQETPISPRESPLAQDHEAIGRIFGAALDGSPPLLRMEDIMAALQDESTDFARQTETTLAKMSPTSLKLTLEGLRRGAAASSMAEDLRMEFRLAQACLRPRQVENGQQLPDFYEGIRAALIDKDQNPNWYPAALQDVSDEWIESFFEPIDQEWEVPAAAAAAETTKGAPNNNNNSKL